MTKEDQSLTSDKDTVSKKVDSAKARNIWEPMKLSYTGEAKDVVRGGGGKLSNAPVDPGEPRKTPPTG